MQDMNARRSDSDIRNEILEELAFDPEVNANEIGVTVVDGAVTLTGTVACYPARKAAERAARSVRGVVAVAEDIKVAFQNERVEDDSAIAKRIAHVLEWDPMLPHETIQAEVRNGAVTLTGTVEWHFQRALAEEHVGRIVGVRSVDNLITVLRHATRRDVKREIARALHRNADVEASAIKVDVSDGIVTLNGTVKAPYEKKVVCEAVWKAPGVIAIEDGLRIV